MKDVIFYGAGRYLQENWNELIKEYRPLCICDKDSEKQGTRINGIVIESIESAKQKYPGANYYVTLYSGTGYRFQVMESLINDYGIEKDRIVNYEDYYFGYGCPLMQSAIIFQHDRIQNCCENMICSNVPHAEYSSGNILDEIYNMKKNAQEQIYAMDSIDAKLDSSTALFEMKDGKWTYAPENKNDQEAKAELHCTHCEMPKKWWWSKDNYIIDYIHR